MIEGSELNVVRIRLRKVGIAYVCLYLVIDATLKPWKCTTLQPRLRMSLDWCENGFLSCDFEHTTSAECWNLIWVPALVSNISMTMSPSLILETGIGQLPLLLNKQPVSFVSATGLQQQSLVLLDLCKSMPHSALTAIADITFPRSPKRTGICTHNIGLHSLKRLTLDPTRRAFSSYIENASEFYHRIYTRLPRDSGKAKTCSRYHD